MPDLEISNLPALAGASLQATDPVAVADLSAAETKKITIKDLLEGGFDLVDDATIPAAKISGSTVGAGAIDTAQLADLAVTTAKINTGAVSFAKIQDINTNVLLGRSTAGTGDVEEITCTSAGRALLDDADAAAQRTTLGLGSLATQSGTFSGTSSGTNTGDQTITLTGDVTGSGTGSFATAISAGVVDTAELADDAVTYIKFQDIPTNTLLGRSSLATGEIEEISCTAAGFALLDDADAAAQRTTLGLGDLATSTGTWVNGSSFSGTSSGTNTGDQTITLTGDVTGSGTGTFATAISAGVVDTAELANDAVTYAKFQDIPTSTLLGRSSLATGGIEEITCTSAGFALLDDADAAAQRTTLGLGDLALATGTWVNGSSFSGTSSGTNTGDQTITLTGDVTGTGTGTFATTISNNAITTAKVVDDAITYAKIQDISSGDILLGRITGAGSVQEIQCTSAGRDLLADATAADQRTTLGLGNLAVATGTWVNGSSFSGTSSGTNTGDQTITLTGDVTGTGTGSFATTISNNAIATANVIDDAITYAKIQDTSSGDVLLGRTTGAGSVQEIACTSAGRDLLADATAADQRTTLGLGNLAVATGTWVNGSSFSGTSSGTNTGDQTIALTGDVTGSGTGTFSTTITAGAVDTTQIADLAVTYGKTNFADGSIPGAKLQSNSVTATQLSENSVGASELADSSVDTNALLDAAVTDAKLATGIDGAKLSNDTVTAAKIPTASLDRGLDKTSGSIGHTNAITAGTRSGITFDSEGHITSTAALAAGDMPLATTTAVGAVSVAADSGLTVSGTGAISITNTLTGGTTSGITFDGNGLITATTSLVAGDLPVATTSAIGAVSVPAVGGLEVDVNGVISIADSGVTAGTYPKVTVNSKGVVTTGQSLVAADIPALDASKITSGTFDIARIAANSVTGAKLADSSTVTFAGAGSSEGVVTFPTAAFQGEFFFDAINRDLYLWDGNAWQPVTITSGEIIFAGTYDASTNLVASVTTAGQAAGLTAGSAVPAASADNRQYYLVVSELGTGTAPVPAVSLNPPDILLSNGSSWELLDVSSFVASQQATNISFTPYGTIQSNNVQTALQELDTEKLGKAGGTMTGNLEIGSTGSLTFEGPTPDLFETTLAVADPTADRTLTFPDVDGTIVTTGDTGTVTSTMIADGTIVNADINASAGIAFSKLATLTSAHFLLGNASNVATATQITGDISVNSSGVAAITAGSIVNADISASAAIAASKIVSGSTSGAGVLQLSDSTTSTSTTLAATANAVKVTKDVADAALPKAGGTVTGTLNIAAAGSLVVQDTSFDATIDTATLTADRTITLPDTTGTVALTSQLDDGTF